MFLDAGSIPAGSNRGGRSVSTGAQYAGLTTGEATDLIGANDYLQTIVTLGPHCHWQPKPPGLTAL